MDLLCDLSYKEKKYVIIISYLPIVKEIIDKIASDTGVWNNVRNIRFITAKELADIGKDMAWNETNWTDVSYKSQPWIYQNLSKRNITTQLFRYWTSPQMVAMLILYIMGEYSQLLQFQNHNWYRIKKGIYCLFFPIKYDIFLAINHFL